MAQNFKITAVSPQTKTWKGSYGEMVDYYVKFEGVDAPVVVTRKPESNAPSAGEELYGNVDMGGKFGPKFKSESKPFGGGGGGFPQGGSGGSKPAYTPKDEKDIHAQFAIREANLQVINGIIPEDALEEKANFFFDMIERVKNHPDAPQLPLQEPADEVPLDEAIDKVFGDTKTIPEVGEIPF